MKIIKRAGLVMLILIVIILLFRGWLYRHLVIYRSIGQRISYTATDKRLMQFIDANTTTNGDHDIEQITKLGLSITSEKLNFTTDRNDVDPNRLIVSSEANCVGYGTFCATTINYLLKKHDLDDTWTAKSETGQLFFLGVNVHRYFHSPFFRDHDFVVIVNMTTGEAIAVDPTVSDYLMIDFITYER